METSTEKWEKILPKVGAQKSAAGNPGLTEVRRREILKWELGCAPAWRLTRRIIKSFWFSRLKEIESRKWGIFRGKKRKSLRMGSARFCLVHTQEGTCLLHRDPSPWFPVVFTFKPSRWRAEPRWTKAEKKETKLKSTGLAGPGKVTLFLSQSLCQAPGLGDECWPIFRGSLWRNYAKGRTGRAYRGWPWSWGAQLQFLLSGTTTLNIEAQSPESQLWTAFI